MKPVIARSVYNTLHLLQHPLADQMNTNLSRASVVKDEALPESVISLNSTVHYLSNLYRGPMRVEIVLPEQEDLKRRKVSVLAPISRALLGYKEGDEVIVNMPSGKKKIRIVKVVNPSRQTCREKMTDRSEKISFETKN